MTAPDSSKVHCGHDGRVVIITGGAQGIGEACARRPCLARKKRCPCNPAQRKRQRGGWGFQRRRLACRPRPPRNRGHGPDEPRPESRAARDGPHRRTGTGRRSSSCNATRRVVGSCCAGAFNGPRQGTGCQPG